MDRDELLKLIDRAAQEGWSKLDLRAQRLTELPSEIGQLTKLQVLCISENNLARLPLELGHLTQLRVFLAWKCGLVEFPSDLSKLVNLQEINLSENELTELPTEIGLLINLEKLIVNGNQLRTFPPEIGQLSNLKKLAASENQLELLPADIGCLSTLEQLFLSINNLARLPGSIGQLHRLQTLKIRDNYLKILPPELGQLHSLQRLDLDRNELEALPAEIDQLHRLQKLDLNSNNLKALPEQVGSLSCLIESDLSHNQLSTLPATLGQLTQLQTLDLKFNQLKILPPEIGLLSGLKELDLSHNQLSTLPLGFSMLAQLRKLDLSSNQFSEIPAEVGSLSGLKDLDLSHNHLITLPASFSQLSQLQMLDLNSNEFETIPAAVCSLDQLAILDLSRNYLIALRPEIGHLQNLVILNLSGDIEGRNQLTSLPPEIGELTRLKRLDLSMTHLETLPPEIRQLTNLKELNLRDTFLPIPTEVLWRIADPTTTIETYFSYLVGQKRPLNEVKLVLLGEGGVGKTSLISRLLHDTYYPPMDKTEGIEIHSWEIANSRNGKSTSEMSEPSIRLNVWDFGGQEIMHATHQFFLTKRTLYVLVLDNRLSEAENRVDYWLTLIRSFGGDSPVLIVGNKRDQHALDLDRRGLLAAYPTVQAILETSCKTGEGILALRDAIAEQVLAMPHVSDPIVTTWFEIKAALEALDADYIPYGDYLRLCREKNVSNPDSQRVLLGFLHDLGVVLHFPDPRLETTNILNPKWVTQGVYRILNTRLTFEEPGILTWSMLARILHDEPYQEKRLFILDMMQKFELCYEMLDRPHTYLIPDLLPKEARDTGPWEGALSFEVHYPVLPGSILTRFIVRMHRHIKDQTVWRTGVLLFCEGNESIVRADLTANRITIAVRGPGPSGRRDLLTRIREYLGAIHATIADLRPAEKVPVPGHPDIPPVDYEWLRNLERKGVPKFYPPGLTEPISVSKLLNGVESPTARHAYPDSLSALRVQLQQLDDVEIDALCIDHFPQVYRAFGRGLRRDEKINQLLAHCLHKPEETHHLAALLLNE